MPYHAAINAHVLHYVVSNHAFTDIEQEKHYCSPYHEYKNAMAPSSTAEQVPEWACLDHQIDKENNPEAAVDDAM